MKLSERLYEDYLKKSRLKEYEKLLVSARDSGYKMLSIIDFYYMMTQGKVNEIDKIIVNRHDIDTSPKVAKEMFDIERRVYGNEGSATYYFRKSTYDENLIKSIDKYGYEVGYHYEEIATVEKKIKTKNIDLLMKFFPEIKKMFLNNIFDFREKSGCKVVSVASHGDFVNVKLNFQNKELLLNGDVRKEAGIIVEAYDDIIEKNITHRYADQILLADFTKSVLEGIMRNERIILMLTHPRNWKVDMRANTIDNVLRAVDGFLYNI